VLTLFLAGAATIAWEAVRERQQAIRADREAAHQKATKDFLVSIFKASDPRIESDRPSGSITAKELLEVSAARIDQEFSQDPQTRIDLLGLTSDIFRELGEDGPAAQQLQNQIQAARQLYGPDHPIVIAALLQQVSDATDRSDLTAANSLLAQTDAAIRRQGLENSALRARWWYVKSATLLTDASSRPQMERALRNSIELFESLDVNDTTYSNALSDLANVYFAQPDFPMAVEYNRRAVAALEHQPRGSEGDLVQILGNLGSSLTYAGNFEDAQRTYSKATELAGRTYGLHHRYYWVSAARYAQTLHLAGDYLRATRLFEELVPTLPTAMSGYRNSVDEHEAAVANEAFATCLLADGRAARAIAYFEAADRQYKDAPQYFYERDHLHSLLAQAYDAIGRQTEAQNMQKEAIAAYEMHFANDNAAVLRQYEYRAESLVRRRQWDSAERDYSAIIARSHNPHAFVVALSEAGLSEIGYARHDVKSAMLHSDTAMKLWEDVQGYRDVRMGPYITRIRAQALFLSGDVGAALVLAERALNQDQRFDAPESLELRAALDLTNTVRAAAKSPP
jgi:serine/threonine-protein kinase